MNTSKAPKILFIGFDYHDYTRSIVKELKFLGYTVTFYSIQPGKPYLKVLRRFAPAAYQPALDQYHAEIIEHESGNDYDFVLFLQVHQFSHANMKRLKTSQKKANFRLYNWDAVTTHDYTPYLCYFDSVFTFDPDDAYKLQVQYLPLFCLRRFQNLKTRFKSPLSVYFIGNIVNPRRYEAVQKFRQYCYNNGISFQYFLSTNVSGLTQMLRAGYLPLDVSLRSISRNRFLEMIQTSNAVFDFANHIQTGYTMRTIENLCAGKKIITNNSLLERESFISKDRVLIFNELNFNDVIKFLNTPLENPEENFSNYHIQRFAQNLLDCKSMDRI